MSTLGSAFSGPLVADTGRRDGATQADRRFPIDAMVTPLNREREHGSMDRGGPLMLVPEHAHTTVRRHGAYAADRSEALLCVVQMDTSVALSAIPILHPEQALLVSLGQVAG
ncbi:MAG: hypothetical protein F2934_06565 [Actinobacteria bacterium]|uniref:Unannotated protein n=1 Tax=freshwater metagenome TaxID=449393 RepID=A0A6J7UHN0_9ZZZZ|nr:hypothetical protein [Actinomycetota bacterium]MSY12670.1 hypothetical protein [Actinomycetota bacterium]MSZ04595.1 hypothetical protein [Actinomycetota bacterium]MTB06776.1 hypothetical protein [Actinomycetota bacterium]